MPLRTVAGLHRTTSTTTASSTSNAELKKGLLDIYKSGGFTKLRAAPTAATLKGSTKIALGPKLTAYQSKSNPKSVLVNYQTKTPAQWVKLTRTPATHVSPHWGPGR